MSQIGKESECPICTEPICTSGVHQVSCLTCGHIFGLSCITKWIQTKNMCPICRKSVEIKEIIPLFWDKSNPLNIEMLESLQMENRKLIIENNKLQSLICDKKKDIADHLFNAKIFLDRVIDSGFRTIFFQDYIIVTAKKDGKFGIEYARLRNLSIFAFLPLHELQIRDLAHTETLLATVSHDKSISIVKFGKNISVSHCILLEIPWSCIWINQTHLAAGASRGTIYIIDSSSCSIISHVSIGGPQFFSLAMFNRHIIALNSRNISFYDIETNKFEQISVDCTAHMIRKCNESPFFSILSFKDQKIDIVQFKGFDMRSHYSSSTTAIERLVRADIVFRNGSMYVAIPEANGLFCLRRTPDFNIDLWSPIRNRFCNLKNKEDTIDLTLFNQNDLYISVITPSRHLIITFDNV